MEHHVGRKPYEGHKDARPHSGRSRVMADVSSGPMLTGGNLTGQWDGPKMRRGARSRPIGLQLAPGIERSKRREVVRSRVAENSLNAVRAVRPSQRQVRLHRAPGTSSGRAMLHPASACYSVLVISMASITGSIRSDPEVFAASLNGGVIRRVRLQRGRSSGSVTPVRTPRRDVCFSTARSLCA